MSCTMLRVLYVRLIYKLTCDASTLQLLHFHTYVSVHERRSFVRDAEMLFYRVALLT